MIYFLTCREHAYNFRISIFRNTASESLWQVGTVRNSGEISNIVINFSSSRPFFNTCKHLVVNVLEMLKNNINIVTNT